VKKVLILIALLAGFAFNASSQINPHAIGLRGGAGNNGNGGEITYQHDLGGDHRLELDLGWSVNRNLYSHMAFTGIYHWWWNLEGGFNWYVGPGAQVGLFQNKLGSSNDGITLGIGGQIGVEYDFNTLDVPLLLSLDSRPMIGLAGGTSGFGFGVALGLRYTF
jgi:hypothetical protein